MSVAASNEHRRIELELDHDSAGTDAVVTCHEVPLAVPLHGLAECRYVAFVPVLGV